MDTDPNATPDPDQQALDVNPDPLNDANSTGSGSTTHWVMYCTEIEVILLTSSTHLLN